MRNFKLDQVCVKVQTRSSKGEDLIGSLVIGACEGVGEKDGGSCERS